MSVLDPVVRSWGHLALHVAVGCDTYLSLFPTLSFVAVWGGFDLGGDTGKPMEEWLYL